MIILGVIALIVFVYGTHHNKTIRQSEIRQIRESYGRPCMRKYDDGVYEHIAGYFNTHCPGQTEASDDIAAQDTQDTAEYFVDDITWNDLDMDDVYRSMNYTLSSAGDEYLYYMLRKIDLSADASLERKEALITHYMDAPDLRFDMSMRLHDMGRTGKYSIYDYLNNLDTLDDLSPAKDYGLLAAYAVSIALCFINRNIGIFALIASLIYGGISYFARKRETEAYVVSFSYIMRLLKGATEISGAKDGFISEEAEQLDTCVSKMSGFTTMSGLVMNATTGSTDLAELILDYIKMFTHIDMIKFFHMRDEVGKHREDIDRMLTIIGLLDACIAIGSYRTYLGTWCVPQFNADIRYEATGLYHPLLTDPVANDVSLKRGMLLTGSNASGKSTMLRTITLAAILAQSIHTVPGTDYCAPMFRIYTSLSLSDSILQGESYYMAEIRALKRITEAGKAVTTPILAAVDEVLRGTNTVERISASTAIMQQLSKAYGLIIAATHDLELTDLLAEYYDNYHFEETITGGDIHFAYKLLPGKAMTRNAIKLLEIMGYDYRLIDEAQQMAVRYSETGRFIL